MVESRSDHLDHVFRALAHPARREILRRIAREEQTVTELAAPFEMSLEAVSKHIQVLERARLLRRTRTGRVHRCRLGLAPLRVFCGIVKDDLMVEVSAAATRAGRRVRDARPRLSSEEVITKLELSGNTAYPSSVFRGTLRASTISKGAASFAAGSGWSGRHPAGVDAGRRIPVPNAHPPKNQHLRDAAIDARSAR
jgi:DNA-binding transcriptional ArsR family regulator